MVNEESSSMTETASTHLPDGDAVVQICRGQLSFGNFVLFQDLSLSLGSQSGPSIAALIGTNGSGKSALANVISGYYRLGRGSVMIGGEDVTSLSPVQRSLRGVRRSFQSVAGISGMTLLSYAMLGWEPAWPRGLFQTVLRLPRAQRQERRSADATFESLCQAGLEAYADKPLESCPYGVRKLADVVRAIGCAPGLVALLDEPTSGVSQSERSAVSSVVRSALSRGGWKLVIVIDHDVAFIRELCDMSVVLEAGKVIATGRTSEVLAQERVAVSFAGVRDRPPS